MRNIIGTRRSGKTTKAIKVCLDTLDCYLVVRNIARIEQIQKEFCKYEKVEMLTYHQLLEFNAAGRQFKNIVIDDADDFLEFLAHRKGFNLLAATFNGPNNFERVYD